MSDTRIADKLPSHEPKVPPSAETESDDFEEMVKIAALHSRATGLRVSLEQARLGSHALLGPVPVFIVTAIVAIQSVTVGLIEDFRAIVIVVFLLASAGFVALFYWAKRARLAASIVGLVLFCILMLPSQIVFGFKNVWYVYFVILICLIDAVRSALQHRKILQRTLSKAEQVAQELANE